MNKVAISESLDKQLSLNKNSKVLIVGLGETGISVAKFFQQQSIECAITDSRDKPPFYDALCKEYPDIPLFLGGFVKVAVDVATHLVVSPGVSLREESIQNAIISGIKIVSDIDLFACATEKPIVAITGSNGKSTVTTMLGAMGNAAGVKTAIGGNLGIPALDLLDETVKLYILELSSFQLERTSVLNARAATVLNISEDHMDRHDHIMEYANEKQKVFCGNGAMVLNQDDSIVNAMGLKERETLTFSVEKKNGFHIESKQNEDWLMNGKKALMKRSELPVQGLHNVANALASFALGTAIGLSNDAMCKALRVFKGLDHRMQKVAFVNGVTWINDSKATNIGACIAALKGYQDKVVLIAGGDAKGADMNELIPAIKSNTKCVVLMGKDAEKIDLAINGCVPAYRAKNIQEAVEIAAKNAEEGESVLLSPACASIDQYKNYKERGEQFTAAVMELAA